ncbi:MAG: hypothetical protein M1818_005791 [Claussenomyces sp. TS43310]|nr:MAG: hypothetical protein M1818_005791 [Claussenomyces sp. TS43310]
MSSTWSRGSNASSSTRWSPGHSTTSTSTAATTAPAGATRTLNATAPDKTAPTPQQSCSFCRRRKIKCDKSLPSCSQCLKSNAQCIYPASQRKGRPRTGNSLATGQSREEQLLRRIKKLETIIESLQGGFLHNDDSVNELAKPLGKLTIGKPYLNDAFWASKELREAIGSSSDEEESEDENTSVPSGSPEGSDFVFGISPVMHDLTGFHPPMQHILQYWAIYNDNCEGLLRLAHVPSMRPIIDDAIANDFHNLNQVDELLMFSIYFAAITSLTEEEVQLQFQTGRSTLLMRFEFAIKHALVRARFMQTQDLKVLQALVIFLTCIKFNDAGISAVVWNMVGLALRIAQSMALDRDGELFDLPPFETEMRRRIWYSILFLDLRTADARGVTSTFLSYDTKLPTLVDETSIYPGMTEPPKTKEGLTDLTLTVCRFDLIRLARRLQCTNARDVPLSAAGKKRCVEQFQHVLKERYIRHCWGAGALPEYSAKTAVIIASRLFLVLHQDKMSSASQAEKDWLFQISIEIMEYYHDLSGPNASKRWAWLLKAYPQWHSIAYALTELCHREPSSETERAWSVIDASKAEWKSPADAAGTVIYNSIKKLLAKAQSRRDTYDAMRSPPPETPVREENTFLTIGDEQFQPPEFDYQPIAHPVGVPGMTSYAPAPMEEQMMPVEPFATTLPEWFYARPAAPPVQPAAAYSVADMTWGVFDDKSFYNEFNGMAMAPDYSQMQYQQTQPPPQWQPPRPQEAVPVHDTKPGPWKT